MRPTGHISQKNNATNTDIGAQIRTQMCLEPSDASGSHRVNMGLTHLKLFQTHLCARIFVSLRHILAHKTRIYIRCFPCLIAFLFFFLGLKLCRIIIKTLNFNDVLSFFEMIFQHSNFEINTMMATNITFLHKKLVISRVLVFSPKKKRVSLFKVHSKLITK